MLKTPLLHPEILSALAAAGHGARVLIADGNFPFSIRRGPNARLVHLNLSPGVVSVTDVLTPLLACVPIEGAAVMQTDEGDEPSVFETFAEMLGETPLDRLPRQAFYDAAASPETCLLVATAEQRLYANILLTLGVVGG